MRSYLEVYGIHTWVPSRMASLVWGALMTLLTTTVQHSQAFEQSTPLKGSFKGDIDTGIDTDVDMDIDSDIAVSINWGSFKGSEQWVSSPSS